MTHIEPDTLVRITKRGHRYYDCLAEISDYVSSEEAEDGEAFYVADCEGGFNNVDLHDGDFVVHLSAEQARSRKPPTVDEVVRGLSLTGDHHDVFDCDETEVDGDIIHCYGDTPDGLRVMIGLRVVGIDQVDI